MLEFIFIMVSVSFGSSFVLCIYKQVYEKLITIVTPDFHPFLYSNPLPCGYELPVTKVINFLTH